MSYLTSNLKVQFVFLSYSTEESSSDSFLKNKLTMTLQRNDESHHLIKALRLEDNDPLVMVPLSMLQLGASRSKASREMDLHSQTKRYSPSNTLHSDSPSEPPAELCRRRSPRQSCSPLQGWSSLPPVGRRRRGQACREWSRSRAILVCSRRISS